MMHRTQELQPSFVYEELSVSTAYYVEYSPAAGVAKGEAGGGYCMLTDVIVTFFSLSAAQQREQHQRSTTGGIDACVTTAAAY